MSRKLKIIVLSAAVVLLVGLILFIWTFPVILKYVVEARSPEILGRQVRVERIAINPLNGVLRVHDFEMYEADGREIFCRFDLLDINITLYKLLGNEIELTRMRLEAPFVRLVQEGDRFNYHDLAERFATDSQEAEPADTAAAARHFNIGPIELVNGRLVYLDRNSGAAWNLDSISAKVPHFSPDADSVELHLRTHLQEGGWLSLESEIDLADAAYALRASLNEMNISVLFPYFLPEGSHGRLGGNFSFEAAATGSYRDPDRLHLKGNLHLSDVFLAAARNDTVLAWQNFSVEVDTLVLAQEYYEFGKISLHTPYIKYELFGNTDNFRRLLVETGFGPADTLAAGSETGAEPTSVATADSTIIRYDNPFTILADYLQLATRNYVSSNFLADSLSVTDGRFVFIDHTVEELFRFDMRNTRITADKLRSSDENVTFHIDGYVNGPGIVRAEFSMSTANYSDFVLNFEIDGFYLNSFSPYSSHYISHPIWDGDLRYVSKNQVTNGYLRSENELHIERIEVGKKTGKKPIYDMPLRLAVSLLRDVNGNIDLSLPVEGDLRDPNYRLGRLVLQILKNLLVKVVSAPFRLLSGSTGAKEEALREVVFDNLQTTLRAEQADRLLLVDKVLKQKPDLNVRLTQVWDAGVEGAKLAFVKAGIDYLAVGNPEVRTAMTADDSLKLRMLGQQDSLFVHYLAERIGLPDTAVFVDDAALRLYNPEQLGEELAALAHRRDEETHAFLTGVCGLPADRFEIGRLEELPDSLAHSPRPKYLIEYGSE